MNDPCVAGRRRCSLVSHYFGHLLLMLFALLVFFFVLCVFVYITRINQLFATLPGPNVHRHHVINPNYMLIACFNHE